MKRTILTLIVLCATLSGCIIVPEHEHHYYAPAYASCLHCWP